MTVFDEIRNEVSKELDVVREGVRLSRERKKARENEATEPDDLRTAQGGRRLG